MGHLLSQCFPKDYRWTSDKLHKIHGKSNKEEVAMSSDSISIQNLFHERAGSGQRALDQNIGAESEQSAAQRGIKQINKALEKAEELEKLPDQENPQSPEITGNDMGEAIDLLNSLLEHVPYKTLISKDAELNRFVVKIADANTGELIREIPNETMLKLARNLTTIKGLLFDKDV